jgi:hypothetical protein
MFAYVSRSDVTWNPSVVSNVQDSQFCATTEEHMLPIFHGNDRVEWFIQVCDEIIWDVEDGKTGRPRAKVVMKAGDVAAMPADIRHKGYSPKRSILIVWENNDGTLPQRYAQRRTEALSRGVLMDINANAGAERGLEIETRLFIGGEFVRMRSRAAASPSSTRTTTACSPKWPKPRLPMWTAPSWPPAKLFPRGSAWPRPIAAGCCSSLPMPSKPTPIIWPNSKASTPAIPFATQRMLDVPRTAATFPLLRRHGR